MNQLLAIVVKELKVLLRDRQALVLLFAMPAFFILVMSYALEGVFEAGSRDRPVEVLVINEDDGSISRKAIADLKQLEGLVLVDAVDGSPLTLDMGEEYIRKGSYPLVVFFGKGFSDRIALPGNGPDGPKATVRFINDPATNVQLLAGIKATIQGVVMRRALLETLSQRLEAELERLAESLGMDQEHRIQAGGNVAPQLHADIPIDESKYTDVVFTSSAPRGFRVGRYPTATEQNVPGYAIFGVFFIVLTLASSLIQEKKEGTFERILASPLSKATLLFGKLLPYYLVNLVQIVLMFAIGVIVFGMMLGNLAALILVTLALALVSNGMGLMVAALGRTEAQVNALSVLLAISLSALGGMMVPTFVMPKVLKTLSLCTPHAWALEGYHDVIVRGFGLRDVLPEVGVLLCFAFLLFVAALARFRFD